MNVFKQLFARSAAKPAALPAPIPYIAAADEQSGKKFMRIHRFYLVGLGYVAAVGRGTLQVRSEALPSSDGYREVVDQFFARWK